MLTILVCFDLCKLNYPVCFRELWRKHGDLITLVTFGQTMIVVCGHKTLTEVLEKNGENTYEHPFVFGFKEYFECSGKCMFSSLKVLFFYFNRYRLMHCFCNQAPVSLNSRIQFCCQKAKQN